MSDADSAGIQSANRKSGPPGHLDDCSRLTLVRIRKLPTAGECERPIGRRPSAAGEVVQKSLGGNAILLSADRAPTSSNPVSGQ
jgi:hypothetical protein